MHEDKEKVAILDFGSQYTQLIARRIRESNVYCEIFPYNVLFSRIKEFQPKGIILSGGPSSVYVSKSPVCDKRIFELKVPVLGICYGMQLITKIFGGEVSKSQKREFGKSDMFIDDSSDLFKDITTFTLSSVITVWMSHGDKIEKMPTGFIKAGHTENSPIAAMKDAKRRLYGIQFHPEVTAPNLDYWIDAVDDQLQPEWGTSAQRLRGEIERFLPAQQTRARAFFGRFAEIARA